MHPQRNDDTCLVCFAVMDDAEAHMRFHRELLQAFEELSQRVRYLEEHKMVRRS